MKRLRVKSKVYDRTTGEYVQKNIIFPISDELASLMKKEFAEMDFSSIEIHGFGAGSDNRKIPGLRTPLCSQKRFFIEPMLHIVDEEGNEMCGWRGF